MKSEIYKSYSVLIASTFAFTVCFMIWLVFAVLGVPIKESLGLSETEFGILVATPILSGSLVRVTLGIWTDRYGGRIVFFLLMLLCVPAIYLLQYATQFWQFLVLGLWLGVVGGSFSVGTPYVARWFPKESQGLAMGIFGMGNSGTAVNKFVAPLIIAGFGWTMIPNIYAAVLLITAILFWFTTYSDPKHLISSNVTLSDQMKLMKNPAVLRYSQYYTVVFGGYVGLSLWMVHYYVTTYQMDLKYAAFLAICFSLPGGVLRALGGWFSDRMGAYRITWGVMWVCWVAFFILSYPQTEIIIQSAQGPILMSTGVNVYVFTILLFTVGIAMAIGKASVFKFVSDDFGKEIGTVSGIVGLAGGLGGFLLPIMFGFLVDITGINTSCFMLMFGAVSVSLIWMHFSFKSLRQSLEKE